MEEPQSSCIERRFLKKNDKDGGDKDDSALLIGTVLIIVFIVLGLLAIPIYRKMREHLEHQKRRREREARIRKDLAVIISSGSDDEKSPRKTSQKTSQKTSLKTSAKTRSFVQTAKIDVQDVDAKESPDKLVKKNLQNENPIPLDLVVNYKKMKKHAS